MAKVEMYTKAFCPFCVRAKALLKNKGVKVIDIPAIDGKHIGGCDDIHALDRRGGLDPLLGL